MRAIGRLAAWVLPLLPGALMHDVLALSHESARTACAVGALVTVAMLAIVRPWRRDPDYGQ